MPDEDNKILKYNLGEKSMTAPFIIYADLECTRVKIILKNLTQKKTKHTPSCYSLFTNCSFDATKIRLIITEVKIVQKDFVKNWESMQWK